MNPRLAVLGGGVSGLTAAYQLRRELPEAEIVLYEASATLGGKLDSVEFPSGVFELGAEAYVGRRPEVTELVEELGLREHIKHPSHLGPAILTAGRLYPMPTGTLMGLPSQASALAGPLNTDEVIRAEAEAEAPLEWRVGCDTSLGDLVASRFGAAVVARLVDPMLGGVYAASSYGLSLREAVPGLALKLDNGARSITEAVRALISERVPGPVFATFDGGYRTFVQTLAEATGARFEMDTRCEGLSGPEEAGTGYQLTMRTENGSRIDHVDGVVVALPVPDALPILSQISAAATRRFGAIRTASSAVVAMEVDRALELPEYSGILVAADESVPFKAMTFSSRKWPHLDDRPGHLLRVSFGRLDADEVLDSDDATLTRLAIAGVAQVCEGEPRVLHSRVRRWTDGLPEIAPGHHQQMADIRSELTQVAPELELVGAATEGVGVPACIGSARAAARWLAEKWKD